MKDFYDYDLIKNCRVCKNNSLKSNFNKNKTKIIGYRSGCRSCCKEYYYNHRDQSLNNKQNFDHQNREKIGFYEKIKRKMI